MNAMTPPHFWKTVLLFAAIHFMVMSVGYFVEQGSGGCMFIIPAYFMVLPVMLPILILRRMGAGTAVFLPYAIVGFLPVYYFEYHRMYGLWAVVAWCLTGPLVGFIADLTYKLLPRALSERWRAIVVGAVIGAAIFVTTYLALTTLYRHPDPESHLKYFASVIFFSLPWLVVNGGFAGYTAYALTKRVCCLNGSIKREVSMLRNLFGYIWGRSFARGRPSMSWLNRRPFARQ